MEGLEDGGEPGGLGRGTFEKSTVFCIYFFRLELETGVRQ